MESQLFVTGRQQSSRCQPDDMLLALRKRSIKGHFLQSYNLRPANVCTCETNAYAPLQEMVAFDLVVPDAHGPPSCGFVIEFDLLHGTANKELPKGVGTLQPPEDLPLVASQSFRIVPSACTGLHAYCAVQFDTLHLALLDATVHCTLLDIQSRVTSGGDSAEQWNGAGPAARGQSPEASLRSRVRALLANPSEAVSPEPHEGLPADGVSPTGTTPRPKHPPMSKMLDSMLASVLPPSMLSPRNAEPAADAPHKGWRRKKPKVPQESEPPEVDYAAALERWSEARDKLQTDLDELRRLLMDHGVSMTSSSRSSRTGAGTGRWSSEGGATTAWEWSARVMRKFVRGLWNEFLELHREQPGVITEVRGRLLVHSQEVRVRRRATGRGVIFNWPDFLFVAPL